MSRGLQSDIGIGMREVVNLVTPAYSPYAESCIDWWKASRYYDPTCQQPGIGRSAISMTIFHLLYPHFFEDTAFIRYILISLGLDPVFQSVDSSSEMLRQLVRNNSIYVMSGSALTLDDVTPLFKVPEELEMTAPVLGDTLLFVVQTQSITANDLVMHPLDKDLWLLLLLYLIAVYLFHQLCKMRMLMRFHMVKYAVVSFFFLITVVCGLYSNLLTLVLYKPPVKTAICNNIDECMEVVRLGKCRAVSDLGWTDLIKSTLYPDVNKSAGIPYNLHQKLLAASLSNPPITNVTRSEYIEYLGHSDKCYIGVTWTSQKLYTEGELACRFPHLQFHLFSDARFPITTYHFFLSPSWKYKEMFRAGSTSDFYERVMKLNFDEQFGMCTSKERDPVFAISMTHLQNAFILLATNSATGFTILITEIITKQFPLKIWVSIQDF